VSNPRLRQVALAAQKLTPVADELQRELGLKDPFHDPGVDVFGLENSVFAIGDTFLEIVAPVKEGTTAGRYLDRRGGDCGYMAIFQIDDMGAARQRITELGIRTVAKGDYDDMATTHLHPKDVPGAIVSLDWANPPEHWRWAGPDWTKKVPAERVLDGIVGLTVRTPDPEGLATKWAEVLGVAAEGATISLDDGRQTITFERGTDTRDEGIVGIEVAGGQSAHRFAVCGIDVAVRAGGAGA
jgi:hypothetical protein